MKLRMGMIGGGPGSFIGPVHRMAAELDGEIELAAGAFSSDPERSTEAGRSYGVNRERAYPSFDAMLAAERGREDRIDFVAIVTPNHLHAPAAKAAFAAGFHVMSDKPATATLDEALDLQRVLSTSDRLYGLTYTYTGYPLVRHARDVIAEGALGTIRKIVVEYPQGWLAAPIESEGSKQASWRVDPAQAGAERSVGSPVLHGGPQRGAGEQHRQGDEYEERAEDEAYQAHPRSPFHAVTVHNAGTGRTWRITVN